MRPTPGPRAEGVATPFTPSAARGNSPNAPGWDRADRARSALRAPRTPTAHGSPRVVTCTSSCTPPRYRGVPLPARRSPGHLDARPKPRCHHVGTFKVPAASTGVEPATDGLSDRCSTTELTCWWLRPNDRVVHASANHSAGAPGGTQEPAPLTRLPSRPRYDPAPTRCVEFCPGAGRKNDEAPIGSANRGLVMSRVPEGCLNQPSELAGGLMRNHATRSEHTRPERARRRIAYDAISDAVTPPA